MNTTRKGTRPAYRRARRLPIDCLNLDPDGYRQAAIAGLARRLDAIAGLRGQQALVGARNPDLEENYHVNDPLY